MWVKRGNLVKTIRTIQMMFNYNWQIRNGYPADGVEKHGLKVFSTFACGGGSTMGYKLAGFDVIGANDIDKQMASVYKANHNPAHYFLMPIRNLLNTELPQEMFELDILDGSPPCSTFSMAGSREKAWKKEKHFREGQAKQVLSDLFFDFLDVANKLRPKVVVAENVKGMLLGNAKAYSQAIIQRFNEIGYNVQLFCLNSASMGVPQARERVFFIGSQTNLELPKLKLEFSCNKIPFGQVSDGILDIYKPISQTRNELWMSCKPGMSFSSVHEKGSFFSHKKLSLNKVAPTLTAQCGRDDTHPQQARNLTKNELCKIGSYPLDYNFLDVEPGYLIGMSVPPVMTAQIAYQVYLQWFRNQD